MSGKLLDEISGIVNGIERYWINGKLAKQLIIEDLRNNDTELISKLLSNQIINERYVQDINGYKIFDKEAFISMLRYKNYWQDSYTKYANKIGLTSEGKYLNYNSDIVLDFPFKDCILEGGMTKEDSVLKNDEKFYNQVIAKEEIDTLFSPKVLSNIKKYEKDGKYSIKEFNESENLILKGNNLIALHSLKRKFKNKIKLIYIDPPYNTGNDSFQYNDKFNHASWLTFMKNRLEIAKELLTEEGVIWVQTDDNEFNYIGVLMDSIFGKQNFVNVISVKTKVGGVSGSSEGKSLKDITEFIQVYAKNKNNLKLNSVYKLTPVSEYIEKEYLEVDKSWKYTSVLTELGEKELIYFDEKMNRKFYHYPNAKQLSVKQYTKKYNVDEKQVYNTIPDKIFRSTNAQSSIRQKVIENTKSINTGLVSIEYYPNKGANKGLLTEVFYTSSETKNMLMFLSDMLSTNNKGKLMYKEKLNTLWDDIEYNNLSKEGGVNLNNGKKPEKLIKNIIELSTDKNDLVLDFFGGSGTTAAVAHKLQRRWITCEQIDNQIDTIKLRLSNVINNKDNNKETINEKWDGGGSFVYAELAKENQEIVGRIISSNTKEELSQQINNLLDNGVLNYEVDFSEFTNTKKEFNELKLEEQKEVLIRVLDSNQLYVNYSDIEDTAYNFTEDEIAFNHSFYGGE